MADWKEHLKEAVRLVGSQDALAKRMGCSQGKVSWLLLTADNLKAEDAVAIEQATEGKIPKSKLRPDLWPAREPAEQVARCG